MLPLEHSAILSTFIQLPVVIKTFVLSIFEWPFYTGFTGIYRVFFKLTVLCEKANKKGKLTMDITHNGTIHE